MIPKLPQISQSAAMRRDDVCLYVSPSSRARLEALIADRNTPSKVVWRAEIVLATAAGCGTNEIMWRTGKSKPCVWRWQERYIEEGVEGLLRDKTRPPGKKPLLRIASTHAKAHWATRALAGIAAFLGGLANAAEQLTPQQRWYRILSHALRHFLRGRVLKPPERLAPAPA
jgi:hypothetical protein